MPRNRPDGGARSRDGTRKPWQLVPRVGGVYVALGGRTHPGLRAVADWFGARVPSAVIDVYPERNQLDAPVLQKGLTALVCSDMERRRVEVSLGVCAVSV